MFYSLHGSVSELRTGPVGSVSIVNLNITRPRIPERDYLHKAAPPTISVNQKAN